MLAAPLGFVVAELRIFGPTVLNRESGSKKSFYGSRLQNVAKTGISLPLMWCGWASEHRGMPVNSVSHTDGGCGDSRNRRGGCGDYRNQAKKRGGRATATRTGEEKEE